MIVYDKDPGLGNLSYSSKQTPRGKQGDANKLRKLTLRLGELINQRSSSSRSTLEVNGLRTQALQLLRETCVPSRACPSRRSPGM